MRFYDFNPPAPCGTGRESSEEYWRRCVFQSTRPLRDGTKVDDPLIIKEEFQSTRPLRDGTDANVKAFVQGIISIHPPLAGRDILRTACVRLHRNFNPPAPCGTGLGALALGLTAVKISIHPPLAGRD